MSITDLLILFGGLAFIFILLRISQKYGNDPHERLKLHEDMGMQFPPGSSFEDKQRMLDMYGLVPRGAGRALRYILVVLVLALMLSFLQS